MTIEEKDRLHVMEEEYRKMLLIQAETYEAEKKQDSDNQWEINGVSPWEL